MSLPTETTIECPSCGAEQKHTFWQSVNVTLDPELKEKLLDRTLMTFRCQKCGESAEVHHDLMYHDMEQNLMVFWGEQVPEVPSQAGIDSAFSSMQATYAFRHVGSFNELMDKVLIWDAGLDDRAVEIFKVLLLQNLEESQRGDRPDLFFSEISSDSDAEAEMRFVLLSESETLDVSVPFEEVFRSFEAEMCRDLPAAESERGKWLRVDRDYALQYLDAE